MDKTLGVIMEWSKFVNANPEGNLEDFCREYLSAQRAKEFNNKLEFTDTISSCQFDLSRVINRLSKLWMHFTLHAMKPFGITSFDEFIFLVTVNKIPHIRKKDLIYMHYIETSSGILIIDRLIKKNFLKEQKDDLDKRSKKLSLTTKGSDTLSKCYNELNNVQKEMYGDMPEQQIRLCLERLEPIEKRIGKKWNDVKNFEPLKK